VLHGKEIGGLNIWDGVFVEFWVGRGHFSVWVGSFLGYKWVAHHSLHGDMLGGHSGSDLASLAHFFWAPYQSGKEGIWWAFVCTFLRLVVLHFLHI
jgi:hypothetical protein